MTDFPSDASVVAEPRTRFEVSQRATKLRKNGKLGEALPLYRELVKDDADSYSAAGLLHCLRKLPLFNEALSLCTPLSQKHIALDWYRNEVIWTLIQGKLSVIDSALPLLEAVAVAKT